MAGVPEGRVVKVYHVDVVQDDGWYVGRVLDRPGVTTQGKTLDELVFMLRDAVELMWNERNVHLELIISPKVRGRRRGKPTAAGVGRAARRPRQFA
jgi:predicted RNase H-like HicB family nuclease